MVKSKWDEMIAEANAHSALSDDAKAQVKIVNERIAGLRKGLKWFSNGYIMFMFLAIIFLYVSILREDYSSIVLNVLFFFYCLYNFAETYMMNRIYSGKLKLHIEKIGEDKNETRL